MLWPRISYCIRPSFEEGSSCEFNPKGEDGTYDLHVQVRYAQRRWSLSPETMIPIVRNVLALRLPPLADSGGFDGTGYSLKIGILTSLTFTWSESIPYEWADLQPIVAQLESLTDIRNENKYLGL